MKIICTECKKEEELNDEIFNEVSSIAKKYRLKVSGYTHILNVMFGKCNDDIEHSFEFDENSKKQIQEIVDKQNEQTSKLNLKILCKICGQEQNLNNETFNLVSHLVEKYKMSISGYTKLLNLMYGNCLYDNVHSFEFDKMSMKQQESIEHIRISGG